MILAPVITVLSIASHPLTMFYQLTEILINIYEFLVSLPWILGWIVVGLLRKWVSDIKNRGFPKILPWDGNKRPAIAPDTDCPICRDELTDPAILSPCGHMFDDACIMYWLRMPSNWAHRKCPYCRTVVKIVRRKAYPGSRIDDVFLPNFLVSFFPGFCAWVRKQLFSPRGLRAYLFVMRGLRGYSFDLVLATGMDDRCRLCCKRMIAPVVYVPCGHAFDASCVAEPDATRRLWTRTNCPSCALRCSLVMTFDLCVDLSPPTR